MWRLGARALGGVPLGAVPLAGVLVAGDDRRDQRRVPFIPVPHSMWARSLGAFPRLGPLGPGTRLLCDAIVDPGSPEVLFEEVDPFELPALVEEEPRPRVNQEADRWNALMTDNFALRADNRDFRGHADAMVAQVERHFSEHMLAWCYEVEEDVPWAKLRQVDSASAPHTMQVLLERVHQGPLPSLEHLFPPLRCGDFTLRADNSASDFMYLRGMMNEEDVSMARQLPAFHLDMKP